ncbi:hypothetical protein R6Q57_023904 [Mikania cordata]
MFKGVYNGKQCHLAGIAAVLSRAWSAGVDRIIYLSGLVLRVQYLLQQYYFVRLECIQLDAMWVVAIGECGLDYDRTHFCPPDIRKKYFERQFELADILKLCYNRKASSHSFQVFQIFQFTFAKKVVLAHSFTGTPEDRDKLLAFSNLYIGINGCSLKTSENLDALKGIPVYRMMIETDSPYCEIKNTHAGISFIKSTWTSKKKEKYDQDCLVKGRNEPCLVR